MNDRADQAAHSAHIEGRDLRDEVDAIVSAALPATPEAGEVDPARVRAALTALAKLQLGQEPGSVGWQIVGDAAESLMPASEL